MEGDKRCEYCGEVVPRRKDDYPKRYAKKRFCNNKCQNMAMRGKPRKPPGDLGEKRCCTCGATKPLADFSPSRKKARGVMEYCRECQKHQRAMSKQHGREAAHSAVRSLVDKGMLLRAREYRCVVCGRQANVHHHQSYAVNDQLNVVPLCYHCHAQIHPWQPRTTPKKLIAGVVALRLGIVRIAIAG